MSLRRFAMVPRLPSAPIPVSATLDSPSGIEIDCLKLFVHVLGFLETGIIEPSNETHSAT